MSKWYDPLSLCFGAELLSSRAFSVSISAIVNRDAPQRLPINGLMLPKVEGVKEAPTLLLPGHMLQVEDILMIDISNREEKVQLIAIDECLGSFAHCDYIVLDQKEDEPDEPESDFSDVWDFI